MMNNPVVLVRSATDAGTKLSAPRREGTDTVIEITLQEGDKMSAGFGSNHLPIWVRWSNQQTDLGQVTFTTHITGYADGLLLPLAYDTRLDWRNIDYFKLYVDKYLVDDRIANLEAPASIQSAPEPPSYQARTVTSVPVAKGIWRLEPGGPQSLNSRTTLRYSRWMWPRPKPKP